MPTHEQLVAVYDWASYHSHYPESSLRRDRETLLRLAAHRPGTRLLDFGCGTGSLLRQAVLAGYVATGAEITEAVARQSGDRAGVPVLPFDELLGTPHQFDVIHSRDVLAHLVDPRETLVQLLARLASGGLLVLDDPVEENLSLVLGTARAWGRLSRRAGVRTSGRGPTMLIRMTARSHQKVLEGLGLTVLESRVTETGWPYYVPRRPVRTPAGTAKALIGRSACVLSRLDPTATLGNRIFAIYRKTGNG